MGYQTIRQPDTDPPLFAIFSTYTDTIVLWDATAEEIEEWFVEVAVERVRRDVRQNLGHIMEGNPRRAYSQFAMTWDEALAEDRKHGGEAWSAFEPTPPSSDI